MADYNVNMKQWNGSSFDNVLPLAFNSKALEGKSYDDIIQYAKSRDLLLYTGQYTGTGTYGSRNPNSITFPFEPILFVVPQGYGIITPEILDLRRLTNDYKAFSWTVNSSRTIYWKKSQDEKSISWYSENYSDGQLNQSNAIYYYAAIGGYDMGG